MPSARVLVVDDSPTILKLVQLVLTKAKYRVTTASAGEAGLVAAKEEQPDLILVDYRLPDISGYDLCGAMSADTVLSSIPVVVMSARGESLEERFSSMANVVDYITKPFPPEALLAVVSHSLEKRARAASAAIAEAAVPRKPLSLNAVSRAPEPEPTAAALAGDLAVVAIGDVLSLLADQGQTGVLSVAHADTRLQTFFANGRIAFATALGVADEFLLGRFVVESGELSMVALKKVLEERAAAPRRTLLGADLVSRGLITDAGLKKAMAQQTAALVYEALRWGGGRFWFTPSTDLPDIAEEASAGLTVDSVLMEGFRRVDEWRLIEREIADFDRVFVRNDARLATFGRGQLTRDEQAVLEFVNGRHSIKEIIYLTSMGSFDVTKMLYRLLRTKLIRHRVEPLAV